MEKQTKLTLTGLITLIVVISFWLLILFPALKLVKRISTKMVCGTNLHGLGTAMTVYANDYNDNYAQLPGSGPWSKELGFSYSLEKPDFENAQSNTPRNVSSSLYLLTREADISPKSFICPHSKQIEFTGNNLDIVELWDFGNNPYKHLSYSYHNPYGNFLPAGNRSAAFAIMADMSPWFKDGNIIPSGKNNLTPQTINIPSELLNWRELKNKDYSVYHQIRELFKPSNSINHLPFEWPLGEKPKYSEGQNVLFADGHTSFETQPNTAVQYDNIYTYWSTDENPTDQDKQGGTAPTSRTPENDAKDENDSFLVL